MKYYVKDILKIALSIEKKKIWKHIAAETRQGAGREAAAFKGWYNTAILSDSEKSRETPIRFLVLSGKPEIW